MVEVGREMFYPHASGFVAFLSFSGGLLRWYYIMILYILRLNEQMWIKHLLLSSNVSVWHICGRTQATEKKATRLESDVHLSHCIQDVSICLMMQLHTNLYLFITYIHTHPPFFFLGGNVSQFKSAITNSPKRLPNSPNDCWYTDNVSWCFGLWSGRKRLLCKKGSECCKKPTFDSCTSVQRIFEKKVVRGGACVWGRRFTCVHSCYCFDLTLASPDCSRAWTEFHLSHVDSLCFCSLSLCLYFSLSHAHYGASAAYCKQGGEWKKMRSSYSWN